MDNSCKTTKIAIFRRFVVVIISWLEIKYVDRTFFDEIANEASIRRMRELLDG